MTHADPITTKLAQVDPDQVQFATMRDPPGDPPSLERRVVVVAPPALVEIAASHDPATLDALVAALADPRRAWPAQVALTALTRRDEAVVTAYQATPAEFTRDLAAAAHQRWTEWLDEHRGHLRWDEGRGMFVVR